MNSMWTPIKARRPKIGKNLYIWYQPKVVRHRGDLGLEARYVISRTKPYGRETTHWMPVPEPPAGVGDEQQESSDDIR